MSWVKGKHSFKIGFDGRKYIAPQTFTQRVRGDYQWYYLTEYLNDVAPTDFGERSTGNFIYYGDETAFYGYANDTWRITEKLSLNYGLRYEFTAVPVGERAQALNYCGQCAWARYLQRAPADEEKLLSARRHQLRRRPQYLRPPRIRHCRRCPRR